MSLDSRIKKIEQRLKTSGGKSESDLSHLTDEELEYLINAFDNDTLDDPKVQKLLSTIETEDLSYLTDEELDREILRLRR